MLETMITTSTTTTASHTPTRRRVAATAASLAVVGALLGMAACSSDDDGSRAAAETVAEASAPPDTKPMPAPPTSPDPVPPTTAAPPPQIAAPPTTAAPPPIAPTPTVAVDPARQAQLAAILTEHQAAGEFVGARIAVRDADGTITEASGGTPTLDPASGPVDPDVPWNIGSATKTFVAIGRAAARRRGSYRSGRRHRPLRPLPAGRGPDHSPPAPQPHQRARRVPRSARRLGPSPSDGGRRPSRSPSPKRPDGSASRADRTTTRTPTTSSWRHHRAGHRSVLGRRGAGPDRRAVGHDPHRSHRHRRFLLSLPATAPWSTSPTTSTRPSAAPPAGSSRRAETC